MRVSFDIEGSKLRSRRKTTWCSLHRLSTVLWLTIFSISSFLDFPRKFFLPNNLNKNFIFWLSPDQVSQSGQPCLRAQLWFWANRSRFLGEILRRLSRWESKSESSSSTLIGIELEGFLKMSFQNDDMSALSDWLKFDFPCFDWLRAPSERPSYKDF